MNIKDYKYYLFGKMLKTGKIKFPSFCYKTNKGNQMKFIIRRSMKNPKRGWYIRALKNDRYAAWFVWKDLELHIGTGHRYTGFIRGYYKSKEIAESYLKLFKEKHNMTENVEITVKVNGVATPLHKISEQTLLTVRENSKPKEIPVARTAESSGHKYLLLKIPSNFGKYEGTVVVIDLKDGYVNSSWTLEREQNNLHPDGVFSYNNIKVIS